MGIFEVKPIEEVPEIVVENGFQTLVLIKDNMRKRQAFHPRLRSNITTAIVLSFVGHKGNVCRLLQLLNHSS